MHSEQPLDEATRRKIIASVMVVMVLGALDTSIVATALPTIGKALGDFEMLPWVATIYLVASTVMTPLYGKLADIHGRRQILLISIGVFVLGSVMCALAPTTLALIVGRAIQGLGGGGIVSIPQTIVGDIVPPRQRGRYQAYFATGYGTALIAGPVLGGFFASQLHWSLIFWINLPIVAVALWLMNTPLRRLPVHHRPHKLDIPGALLMALATMTFLLALDWAAKHSWLSTAVLTLFGLSTLFWVAFAFRNRYAPEPLVPFAILKEPVVAAATLASFFGFGAFVGLMLVVPVFLQVGLGLATGASSLAFLVLTIATVTGSAIGGRLTMRLRRYRLIGVIGQGVAALALVILALFGTELPIAALVILFALVGMGLGTVFPVGTVTVQSAVAMHHLGIATATLLFIRWLGGAVGAATLGGIALAGSTDGAAAESTFTIAFLGAALFAGFASAAFALMEDRPLRNTLGTDYPAAATRQEDP